MEGVDGAAERLDALKAMGVSLALDDFGTGYSSLSHVQRFPIDTIKLDRSFVAGLGDDGKLAIVTAVATMSRGLRLPAVAEGVEDLADVPRLRALGYTYAQGYAFARPQAADETLRLIERREDRAAA